MLERSQSVSTIRRSYEETLPGGDKGGGRKGRERSPRGDGHHGTIRASGDWGASDFGGKGRKVRTSGAPYDTSRHFPGDDQSHEQQGGDVSAFGNYEDGRDGSSSSSGD